MPTDYTKDPASKRSYTFDRAAYLAPGAKITASTWEVPTDLTSENPEHTDTTTEITLSGGQVDHTYTIYNTFDTDDDQSYRAAFSLRVVDAADIHEPTELEKQLQAVRVALGQKVASDTEEYQIANRMKRRYSFEDLLNWEKRLTELVNAERRANGAASGFFKNHAVRPVEPGP
jgi:hypothetical protein